MASIDAGNTDNDGTMSTLDDVEQLEANLAATPPAIAPLRPARAEVAAVEPTTTLPAVTGAHSCQNCGTLVAAPKPSTKVTAASFGPTCDFPLFGAAEAEAAKRRPDPSVRRRHPGVEGREALGSYRCRECGEPNPPDPEACCIRCGAALTPPPLPAPPPPPPDPVTIFVTRPYRRWKIAALLLAASTAGTTGGLVWALVTR